MIRLSIISFVFGVLATLMLVTYCTPSDPVIVSEQSDTSTVITPGDSAATAKPVVIISPGVIDYFPDTIRDTTWLYHEIDTAAILADYIKHRRGHDTIVDDSSTMVAIGWHVHRNRLISVQAFVQNRRAVEIHHTTTIMQQVEQPRGRLYAGLGVGRSPDQFGLAPALAYQSKRQVLYTLNYDIIHKDIYLTVFFPLWPSGR